MKKTYRLSVLFILGFSSLIVVLFQSSCSNSSAGNSYDFTSTATISIGLNSRRDLGLHPFFNIPAQTNLPQREKLRITGPTLCSSVVCVTPTALTGKYYGSGFLIQAGGQGMVAYFGREEWSSITGSSDSFSFDSSSPITNSGNLKCCGGTGDLSSNNTYIESIIYLFGYLDATFALSGITSNTNMNRTFTVRFVLADDAITGGVRGDLLLKDPTDSVFKWMDTSASAGGDVGAGTLVTTRPASPVTMNTSVTNWTNPYGSDQGNQSIPVIYAPVLPESESGVFTITKAQLETAGRAYTYNFDPANFVMFPAILTADLNTLSTYAAMLSKIHLGGLPFSTQTNGVGNPASTVLTVTDP